MGTRVRGFAKGRPETRNETTATATAPACTFAARNRLADWLDWLDWLRLHTSGWTDAMGREDNVGAFGCGYGYGRGGPRCPADWRGTGGVRGRTAKQQPGIATFKRVLAQGVTGEGERGRALDGCWALCLFKARLSPDVMRSMAGRQTADGRAGIASTWGACASGRLARGCPGTPHLAGQLGQSPRRAEI